MRQVLTSDFSSMKSISTLLNGMLVQCTVTPKDDIRQYSFVYIAGNWHSENSVRLPRTQNAGCEAMRT